jgi:hypothetical protein
VSAVRLLEEQRQNKAAEAGSWVTRHPLLLASVFNEMEPWEITVLSNSSNDSSNETIAPTPYDHVYTIKQLYRSLFQQARAANKVLDPNEVFKLSFPALLQRLESQNKPQEQANQPASAAAPAQQQEQGAGNAGSAQHAGAGAVDAQPSSELEPAATKCGTFVDDGRRYLQMYQISQMYSRTPREVDRDNEFMQFLQKSEIKITHIRCVFTHTLCSAAHWNDVIAAKPTTIAGGPTLPLYVLQLVDALHKAKKGPLGRDQIPSLGFKANWLHEPKPIIMVATALWFQAAAAHGE